MSSTIPEKLLKPYDPKETEARIGTLWEESGFFNPDVCVEKGVTARNAEVFSVVLPPPNVTGVLHIGHAYEDALQDVVVRFKRMRGKKTLWIPGTDSAAIATQARVEKNISKNEGKTRRDLGREELVRRVSEYAKESEGTIVNQIRKVGASLDWSRYAYALDEKRSQAVFTAFTRMYDAGLIYRENRIVNWDPKGQTTISDDEVVYEERDAKLYTFRYSKDFPIAISTTRPETKVGDTAVAVHPDDARYTRYIGKEYDAIFCDVPIHIKIVADTSVEKDFGTGALGVTPAHSMTDWDIAERHDLPRQQILNEYAQMTVPGRLHGKKTTEARDAVVLWLIEEKLLEKTEDIKQNVSTSERTGAIIEPLPKLQWWIAVNKKFTIHHSEIPGIHDGDEITLAELMRTAVESGAVNMPQEGFRKSYFHWIDTLHDWCISRQIWFGHRIPVWYRGTETYVGILPPTGEGWAQDEDVLDTWFSSSLWTFSTLGWPHYAQSATRGKPGPENDFANYHPTSFMSPAYEILYLWVSRMILASGFHLGQIPFQTVLIHGLVRDQKGRKFSKSLGNGVDPLELIEKYGADALRMGLLVGTAIGNDIKFDENKVRGYKHFANKLWNITRFVLEQNPVAPEHAPDTALVKDFEKISAEVTADIEGYRLHLAAEKLYAYVWHEFADKILEESKVLLFGTNEEAKMVRAAELLFVWTNCIKLLHPFMPFITEDLWSILPQNSETKKLLIVTEWPNEN